MAAADTDPVQTPKTVGLAELSRDLGLETK